MATISSSNVNPDSREAFMRHGFSSLIATRAVDSATERSLPGAPGQRTVTASRHRRIVIVASRVFHIRRGARRTVGLDVHGPR